jgi:hypothetical protein
MDNTFLRQPRKQHTTAEAVCKKCGKVLYSETLVEENGKFVERIVEGVFRQALNEDGEPTGPVIPFCNCGE